MNNLRLHYGTDWEGNRFTTALYTDDDGTPRSTKLNGSLYESAVRASILNHRRRTAAQ